MGGAAKPLTELQKGQIIELYRAGKSHTSIAAHIEIRRHVVAGFRCIWHKKVEQKATELE
jgi:hypothetical protein